MWNRLPTQPRGKAKGVVPITGVCRTGFKTPRAVLQDDWCDDAHSRLPWWESLTNHRRFAMRQWSLLVSVVVVLAGALAFGRVAPDTVAQDATPASTNPSAGERDHIDLAIH